MRTFFVRMPPLISLAVESVQHYAQGGESEMKSAIRVSLSMLGVLLLCMSMALPAAAQEKKPNIIVIFGDEIGIWNNSAYHRGMMGVTTPNIDRIAKEGALFTDSSLSDWPVESGIAGRKTGIAGQGPNHRRTAQAIRLRDRPDWEKPPRRP
jgi:hypothetical protein